MEFLLGIQEGGYTQRILLAKVTSMALLWLHADDAVSELARFWLLGLASAHKAGEGTLLSHH